MNRRSYGWLARGGWWYHTVFVEREKVSNDVMSFLFVPKYQVPPYCRMKLYSTCERTEAQKMSPAIFHFFCVVHDLFCVGWQGIFSLQCCMYYYTISMYIPTTYYNWLYYCSSHCSVDDTT